MRRTPIPAAVRIGLSRPSAATTSRARRRLPSLSPTRASPVRVNSDRVPVPGRNSTVGSSASCAASSRRSSQLGRFQPNG